MPQIFTLTPIVFRNRSVNENLPGDKSFSWVGNRKVRRSWYPRTELNRDPSFRKRLLYPFELRGRGATCHGRISDGWTKTRVALGCGPTNRRLASNTWTSCVAHPGGGQRGGFMAKTMRL